MKSFEKQTIRFGGAEGRRGSVIVLVVAVLALLAVIGTVYITSARSERAAAQSGAVAANLDLAQKAVNEQFVRVIGDAVHDGVGVIGGGKVGTFGNMVARTHDMPEFNIGAAGRSNYNLAGRDESWLVSNLYRPGYEYLSTVKSECFDLTMPQTWVANTVGGTTYISPSLYDPASGVYDIPVFDTATGRPEFPLGRFRVVPDPANNWPTIVRADNTSGPPLDDAIVQMLPFSEASGVRYRFGIRIIDTSRMANLNVGMVYTNVNDPSMGTFNGDYVLNQYGARVDVTADAGIFNRGLYAAGMTADTATYAELYGTSGANNTGRMGNWPMPSAGFGYWWNQATFRFENRAWQTLPFDLADELELRSYGSLGTMTIPRPAMGYTAASQIWPNTLGNRNPSSNAVTGNMYRGHYTAYSYSRDLRSIPDPVNTSNGRSTAYSVMPSSGTWAVPPLTDLNTASYRVWPPYPARVAATPDISAYTSYNVTTAAGQQAAAEAIAIAATNIATAMRECTYTLDEQCAFVANYLTNRWSGWVLASTQALNGVTYDVYALPGGPSYVDSAGMSLHAVYNNAGAATAMQINFNSDLNSQAATPANKIYLGYAAQPFINEVAAQYTFTPAPLPGSWSPSDAAIELYNPYNVALSLDDYQIVVDGGTPIALTNQWIPPGGYFVLTQNTGVLDATIPAAGAGVPPSTKWNSTTLSISGATQVYLKRKYYDRLGALKWAVVDQYNVTNIAALPAIGNTSPETDFEARPNVATTFTLDTPPKARDERWLAAIHDTGATSVAEAKHVGAASLGNINGSAGAQTKLVPLFDRVPDLAPTTGAVSVSDLCDADRLIPQNITEFNKIMRICHMVDAAGMPATTGSLIPAQAFAAVTGPWNANVQNTLYPAQASVYFDYFDDPYHASGVNAPAGYVIGDIRAEKLFGCLAFADRVSDLTLNLGDNSSSTAVNVLGTPFYWYDQGLSKLRIPGKINVNTASAEVLASIPVFQAFNTTQSLNHRFLIGAIMAYRWRTTTQDPRIPRYYQLDPTQTPPGPVIDFTNTTSYPGYGIRSLAELQVPLRAYQEVFTGGAVNTALYQNEFFNFGVRDAMWGQMCNALTVRSDTFVVYAYLEAVRVNPRYTPGGALPKFNNQDHWYTTNNSTAGIGYSDDPNDKNFALQRVARRRWVAIVDRSQANYSRFLPAITELIPTHIYEPDPRYAMPRIVAQKDLPR